MRESHLERQVRQYRDTHTRVKLWQRLVAVLGCLSIFCTTYAMILPAITMTNNDVVNCGLLEHKHTDECYVEETVLHHTCEEALHRHTADCFDIWGECICGYADYYIHTHDEGCYDAEGTLICPLPEVAEHVHDESCFDTETVCTCGRKASEGHTHSADCYVQERALVCEESDGATHTHSADCYSTELTCTVEENHVHTEDCYAQMLVCEETDPAHTHTEDCFASVLVCETEEGHIHGDECYASVLTCGEGEAPAHTHTDECYEMVETLACGLAESEAHAHTEECTEYRTVVVCPCEQAEYDLSVTEAAFHQHDAGCFDGEGNLICGHVEILRHTHDHCAYETTERVLTCPLPEHEHDMGCFPLNADESSKDYACGFRYEHTHSDECYSGDVLICNLVAHTHSAACLPADRDADLETAEDWERSFAGVELTTNWAGDVVRIAETQLGCAESRRNFELADDGEVKGVSRYGQWARYPYADWDAMFVSFCLTYAGVDANAVPQDTDAARWEALLRNAGYGSYRAAGSYAPKRGDLVFFDYDGDAAADRVGVVYDILATTGEIYTIEGDREDAVNIAVYDPDAPSLLAFCAMPENPDEVIPVTALTAVTQDGAEVVVTGRLPDGARLSVQPMELSEEELNGYLGEERAAGVSEHAVYDICILTRDGAEWQPDGSVSVVIRQGKLRPEEDETVSVLHLDTESGEAAELDATVTAERDICFETGGFSPFIVLVEPDPATLMATSHLPSVITGDISIRTSYLYNIDYSSDDMAPLAGVTYTVYNTNGTVVGTVTTGSDYPLSLEKLTSPQGKTVTLKNGTTYKVAQTGVPEGYIAVPQTTTFTMTSAGAAVGMFFDYRIDEFAPTKTAEVLDAEERTYGVTINAVSGKYDCTPSTMNISLVVDRSGSMLFPANLVPLEKDGKPVKVRFYLDNSDSDHSNLKKNRDNLTAALGTNASELYYVVADVNQTATAYAIWYDSSIKDWYYQDVSSYARAYQGESGFSFPSNAGWQGNSSIYGGVISKSEQKDHFRTDINNSGLRDPKQGNSAYYDYQIYTADEYNRLTYLKDAVNQLVSQLISLKRTEDTIKVSLVTFCNDPTYNGTYNLSNENDIKNLRSAVSNITTSGGTRQDKALKTVIDNNLYQNGAVILITDGALTDKSGESTADGYAKTIRGTTDLNKSGDTGSKLITVGLSMENVDYGKTLLTRWATLDENGERWFYNVDNTSDLTNVLLQEVLSRVIRKDKETENATIRDYISDSFYAVDPDTNEPLEEGTKLALDGSIYVEGSASAPYLVDNSAQKVRLEPGDRVDKKGIKTSSTKSRAGQVKLDSNAKPYIEWTWWNNYSMGYTKPTLTMVTPEPEPYGTLLYDEDAGKWYVEWSKHTLPLSEDGAWKGQIVVKAKEDFIGGNVIDTNAGATLQVEDETGTVTDGDVEPYRFETPTVNVALLGMNEWSSEETVFKGDPVPPEDRLKALFEKLEFTKIVSGTGDVLNKADMGTDDGLEAGSFDLTYAMNGLSDEDWAKLLGPDVSGKRPTVTVPYTYDSDSSHGAVGNFVFSVTVTNGSTGDHAAGDQTETYTLNVKYEPITNGRATCEHNGTAGPGAQVTKNSTPLTGELISTNRHDVAVIKGKISIYKCIDESLVGKTGGQQTTFELYALDENGELSATPLQSVTVNVPTTVDTHSAAAEFKDLPRGRYVVKEKSDPDNFVVSEVDMVGDGTNCYYHADNTDITVAEFHIGWDADSADVIEKYEPVHEADGKLTYSYTTGSTGTTGEADFLNKAPEIKKQLPVLKSWAGGSAGGPDATVYVMLCDKQGESVLNKDGKPQLLALTKTGGWKGSFQVIVNEKDADPLDYYTVCEVTCVTTGGTAADIMSDTGTVTGTVNIGDPIAENTWAIIGDTSYIVSYGQHSDGKTLLITNRTGGELPATGGSGSGWVLGLGAGLVGLAAVGWLVWRTGAFARFRKKDNE